MAERRVWISVMDPLHFNADPNPAFHYNANPDPTFHLMLFNAHLAALKFKRIQVVNLLKETAEIETGIAEKSSWNQSNRQQKHWFWFGEIERKLAKLSLNYFMVCRNRSVGSAGS